MSTHTFLDTLRITVAKLQAAHPEREGELARAHALILHGMVVPSPEDLETGQVLSSDGQKVYHVNGSCSCTAGEHGRDCKHQHAWKLYKYIQGKVEAPVEMPHGIDPRHVVQIQGKPFVKFAGLLDLAHQRGLQSLKVDWTFNDAELSLAHAVAVFPFGTFEESGDATPANVNKKVAPHFRRCALTRAAARVLRDALNCDMVALEELADE